MQRGRDAVVQALTLCFQAQLVESRLAEVGGVHAETLSGQEKRVATMPGAELEHVIDACGTERLGRPLRGGRRLRSVQLRMVCVRRLPTFLLSSRELDVSSLHVAPRVRHAGLDDRQTAAAYVTS